MYQNCGISDISKYSDDSLIIIANEDYLTKDDIKLLKDEVNKTKDSFYEKVPKPNKTK